MIYTYLWELVEDTFATVILCVCYYVFSLLEQINVIPLTSNFCMTFNNLMRPHDMPPDFRWLKLLMYWYCENVVLKSYCLAPIFFHLGAIVILFKIIERNSCYTTSVVMYSHLRRADSAKSVDVVVTHLHLGRINISWHQYFIPRIPRALMFSKIQARV